MTGATPYSLNSLLRINISRNQLARAGRAESRTQLARIQVFVKTRPAVLEEAFVDYAHCLLLIAADRAVDGKDRQDAALVTQRAVVVAIAQLPTSLDRNRTIAAKGPEIIFEVSVGRSVRARHY